MELTITISINLLTITTGILDKGKKNVAKVDWLGSYYSLSYILFKHICSNLFVYYNI